MGLPDQVKARGSPLQGQVSHPDGNLQAPLGGAQGRRGGGEGTLPSFPLSLRLESQVPQECPGPRGNPDPGTARGPSSSPNPRPGAGLQAPQQEAASGRASHPGQSWEEGRAGPPVSPRTASRCSRAVLGACSPRSGTARPLPPDMDAAGGPQPGGPGAGGTCGSPRGGRGSEAAVR